MSHADPTATPDETERWQAIRHQVHTIAAAVLVLLVTMNVIDQATSTHWLDIATQVLNIAGLVLPLVAAVAARRNSDPKKVVVAPVAQRDDSEPV